MKEICRRMLHEAEEKYRNYIGIPEDEDIDIIKEFLKILLGSVMGVCFLYSSYISLFLIAVLTE